MIRSGMTVGIVTEATKTITRVLPLARVAAIRVDPLPDGTTDFDWYEGGWNLVDKAKLVIYGAIDPTYLSGLGARSQTVKERLYHDVKISFALLSLGQVGEATTLAGGGHSRKDSENGPISLRENTSFPSRRAVSLTRASLSTVFPIRNAIWTAITGTHGTTESAGSIVTAIRNTK